jgi:hypothetical protein
MAMDAFRLLSERWGSKKVYSRMLNKRQWFERETRSRRLIESSLRKIKYSEVYQDDQN